MEDLQFLQFQQDGATCYKAQETIQFYTVDDKIVWPFTIRLFLLGSLKEKGLY